MKTLSPKYQRIIIGFTRDITKIISDLFTDVTVRLIEHQCVIAEDVSATDLTSLTSLLLVWFLIAEGHMAVHKLTYFFIYVKIQDKKSVCYEAAASCMHYINLLSGWWHLSCKLSPHHLLFQSFNVLQPLQFKSGTHWGLQIRRTRCVKQPAERVAGQCADGVRYPQPWLHVKYIILVQHAGQLQCIRQATATIMTTSSYTSQFYITQNTRLMASFYGYLMPVKTSWILLQ